MGKFDASLRTVGDRTGLPATVTLLDGRISINANDQTIGEWALNEVSLEPIPTGYRMAAEGEQLLIDLPDADGFAQALIGKKPKGKKKEASERPKVEAAVTTVEPEPKHAKRTKAEKPAKEPKAEKAETAPPPNTVMGRINHRIDEMLDYAGHKWDSLLPAWFFTRGMVYLLAALLVVILVMPGLMFYILLFSGVLLVMFGAVAYTDPVAAARWLPGRMTPMHVLIYGVGILLLGVLVGMASQNPVYIIVLGVGVVLAAVTASMIARKKSA